MYKDTLAYCNKYQDAISSTCVYMQESSKLARTREEYIWIIFNKLISLWKIEPAGPKTFNKLSISGTTSPRSQENAMDFRNKLSFSGFSLRIKSKLTTKYLCPFWTLVTRMSSTRGSSSNWEDKAGAWQQLGKLCRLWTVQTLPKKR